MSSTIKPKTSVKPKKAAKKRGVGRPGIFKDPVRKTIDLEKSVANKIRKTHKVSVSAFAREAIDEKMERMEPKK